ncbi:hypothetical protein Ccrd_007872 [Cynara cardunculus var. scolymus]|uniref:Uncharacterized protein n=1 Tax=Cynara cardunculus var. scolymus TaxID=59895 RepID=A0A103XG40_CYNCS|nr:hypothetical protein Ccrd_007872 [Cynara cardunculus var. scolymus]
MATKMQFSGLSRLLSTHKQETDRHGMQQLHMNMRDERVCYRNCNLTKAMSSMIGDSVRAPDPTPSDTIKQFYECMNEKNIKLLEDYISNDCFFEDYSFPKPFNGKKVRPFGSNLRVRPLQGAMKDIGKEVDDGRHWLPSRRIGTGYKF